MNHDALLLPANPRKTLKRHTGSCYEVRQILICDTGFLLITGKIYTNKNSLQNFISLYFCKLILMPAVTNPLK